MPDPVYGSLLVSKIVNKVLVRGKKTTAERIVYDALEQIETKTGIEVGRSIGVARRRREVAEHPFGSIKQWMNQGAFLMRGLENVRGEFSLTALAYNLRRVLNLVGFKDLLAAVAV